MSYSEGGAEMSNEEKVIEYELQIEDMLHALQERLDEIGHNPDDFERGRKLAYIEMMDIIKTRHQMILDVITE